MIYRIMYFFKATRNETATMSADDTQTIKWYIDAAYAIHKNTWCIFLLRNGAVTSDSTKHNVNFKSLTGSEIIAVDDMLSRVLWTKGFIEALGHQVKANIIYQDNTIALKIKASRKESSGKCTRLS